MKFRTVGRMKPCICIPQKLLHWVVTFFQKNLSRFFIGPPTVGKAIKHRLENFMDFFYISYPRFLNTLCNLRHSQTILEKNYKSI